MSNNHKFVKKGSGRPQSKLVIALTCVAAVLLVLVIALILLIPKEEVPAETTAPTVPVQTNAPTTESSATVPPTTIPEATDAQMLDWMAEKYQQNPDIGGWIKIEGTKLNNPVMYVKDDNYKYLYRNFNGNPNAAGTLYIKGACRLDPESTNLIIYGHNMLDGSMFGFLSNYKDEKYYQEHPIIEFSTLYEERKYEIVAAFYDRIYDDSEDCFKFYNFIYAQNEDDFNEAYNYFKTKAEYETGITAEFGDHLITLITCSYHVNEGRFVVVARQVEEAE